MVRGRTTRENIGARQIPLCLTVSSVRPYLPARASVSVSECRAEPPSLGAFRNSGHDSSKTQCLPMPLDAKACSPRMLSSVMDPATTPFPKDSIFITAIRWAGGQPRKSQFLSMSSPEPRNGFERKTQCLPVSADGASSATAKISMFTRLRYRAGDSWGRRLPACAPSASTRNVINRTTERRAP